MGKLLKVEHIVFHVGRQIAVYTIEDISIVFGSKQEYVEPSYCVHTLKKMLVS
jgi:hypothetical protein